ncbi:hypothetical protein [Haloarchaeobius sp. FL176]|uniref:hypothetical protein n=1 Tax=Haloarchaeobius sp. FL176 TaxID=2967129 RepID=UPI0021497B7B|nr:hypothetical protein [Haloarchaeobius sp. FL176]
MSADRFGITTDELRYRKRAKPKPTTAREFRCDECGARCTRTLRGREAGHRKGCSRRLQRLGKGKRAQPASDGGDGDDGKLRPAVVDAVQLGGRENPDHAEDRDDRRVRDTEPDSSTPVKLPKMFTCGALVPRVIALMIGTRITTSTPIWFRPVLHPNRRELALRGAHSEEAMREPTGPV